MLALKQELKSRRLTQAALARAINVSSAAVAQLVNHNQWPKSIQRPELEQRILSFIGEPVSGDVFEVVKVEPPHCHAATPDDCANDNHQSEEDDNMLLRKQVLTPAAKKAFGLFRDPFADLQCSDDMWVSPDIRYVREAMFQTAKHGGFLAVVGESGAGKSTLRRDLENRIEAEHQPITMIQPYVLAAEDNDRKGKTLKSTHIAEAILSAVAPLERPRSSPQARFQQLHQALKESHSAGYKHCLVIEEAHSLPIPTLKHLKRIMELEVGFTKLVSVILIGQPELTVKLSERNLEVREVVQRCEVVHLQPIEPGLLLEFLGHRFSRCGNDVGKVIDDSGLQALSERLVNRDGDSQLYPLAIGNFVIAAANLAAQIGVPMITREIVTEV